MQFVRIKIKATNLENKITKDNKDCLRKMNRQDFPMKRLLFWSQIEI